MKIDKRTIWKSHCEGDNDSSGSQVIIQEAVVRVLAWLICNFCRPNLHKITQLNHSVCFQDHECKYYDYMGLSHSYINKCKHAIWLVGYHNYSGYPNITTNLIGQCTVVRKEDTPTGGTPPAIFERCNFTAYLLN